MLNKVSLCNNHVTLKKQFLWTKETFLWFKENVVNSKKCSLIQRNRFVYINQLTPKITDFLTHFWSLLPKRKREYIMTKPCINNAFGSPLSIYEVKITLPCTGIPIWQILLKIVAKIWNLFFYSFFFKWINILVYFKLWTKVEKIVVVYEKYFLVQLPMFYLFENGGKL